MDGIFSATHNEEAQIAISFQGDDWWNFASPQDTLLTPGIYEQATRYPFQDPVVPGLSVSGAGRGCNQLKGRFQVLEAVCGPGNEVERFAADFVQSCEGFMPPLNGTA